MDGRAGEAVASGEAADTASFLAGLREQGIQVWIDGEELRLRAPKGRLTPPLKASLAERKPDIVAWLRERSGDLPPLVAAPADRGEPFAMTQMQEAYWLGQSDAFDLGGVNAHAYWEYEFEGVDLDRLRQAVDRLVARHDMLRMHVLESGRQQVLDAAPCDPMVVEDLRGLDDATREARLLAVRERMCGHGPRTDRWPLFELLAHRLPRGCTRFHVSVSLLLVDGKSVETLTRELLALYRDPDAPLAPLGVSYRDYLLAMAGRRASSAMQRAKAYWTERLADMPPAPELPLALAASAVKGARLARRAMALDEADWAGFQANARRSGVFAGSALCAAYCAVLARWSKHPRFTLNVLDGQRLPLHPDIDAVVGNFSHTMLTVVDAGAADTLQALAQQLQHRRLADRQHAAYSGVSVLRDWNRINGSASAAGVPVVFNSLLDVVGEDIGGASSRELHAALQTPQVYLDHQARPAGSSVELLWDTVDAMFPPGLLDTMFAAYGTLLQRLARDPLAWTAAAHGMDTMALQPPAGRAVLAMRDTLHAQAWRGMQRQAARPALVSSCQRLDHAGLAALAEALAARVCEAGAKPGELVAVVMEKGWEQVVAVLAVNLAGAAYLPIDAALPPERICHLLDRGEVRIVLTQPQVDDAFAWPAGLRRIRVDDAPAQGQEAAPLPGPATAEDLAYVIFTSGSTGEPKGVMIDHRGALNTVLDINRRFGLGPGDRVLAVSSLGFDLSVWDIYGLLCAGGTVVMPAAGDIRDPARLLAWVRDEGITVWNSVPAVVEMLVEHLAARGERLPECLRLVMMSGDWIPVTLPQRLRSLSDRLDIVSLGGATEASIWSIFHVVDEVPAEWKSIPYGRALAGQQVHVLDAALRERETWVPGELYISGVGVALGYWRDPRQTGERFITAPDGRRMYRTGDWGRTLPGGEIEFLGRDDLQVKVQGFRIELGEIEAALQRHPSVRAAVAAAVGGAGGGKRLVAHVVPRPGAAVDAEGLRAFLAQRLPSHMVPTAIHEIDTLPLSANGKVDRKRLAVQATPAAGARECVAPRDGIESALLEVWHALLPHRPIGVRDSFFELGGDSLRAVRLGAAIQKRMQRPFSVATLFRAPTIEAIALALRDEPAAASALVAVQPEGHRNPLYLVHPVGGNVLCYSALARELGKDQPVFAFQARGLDGLAPPRESVEEMAAAYVEELRRHRPRGPYRLGGWSMGGVIAAEMAAQLEAAGEPVEGVALLDSVLPPAGSSVALPALLERFLQDLGLSAQARDALAPQVASCDDEASLQGVFASEHFAALRIDDPLSLFRVFAQNMRALKRFVPRPCRARQLLLRATVQAHSPAWLSPPCHPRSLPRLVVRDVAGDHFSMMSPPRIDAVALQLAAFFETSGAAVRVLPARRHEGADA